MGKKRNRSSAMLEKLRGIYFIDPEKNLNILWHFLNEICTVIHYLDCHGKGNWSKHLSELGWEKVPNWDMYSCSRRIVLEAQKDKRKVHFASLMAKESQGLFLS